MPTYLSPGVYVEEVPAGIQPLEGVGTSTGAFVGVADRASVATDEPVLVTNFSQFVQKFGGFRSDLYLAYGVYSFFAEGGSRCYVSHVKGSGAASASIVVNDNTDVYPAFTITALSDGEWGNRISYLISASTSGTTNTFKLTIRYQKIYAGEFPTEGDFVTEVYDELLLGTNTVSDAVNGVSSFVTISSESTDPTYYPANLTDYVSLVSGSDDVTNADFIGDSSSRLGLHSFDTVDEINIVAIPDLQNLATSTLIRDASLSALAYCQGRKDCFFIVDSQLAQTVDQVKDYKTGTGGEQAMNTAFGALYYPWISLNDPVTRTAKMTPPSGAIAGIYASTDSSRGVHKAPAGTVDGHFNVAVGVETVLTKGDQDILNPLGVNVIRALPNQGIVIWGARTLSSEAEWRYVNVRRLMSFIGESIDEGTQFVVFEPNNPVLWGRVRRTITAFLTRVWRDGALFGGSPEDAFYVKVDEENNPAEVRDAGQLIVEVGVAPVKPAEFVVIRVSQQTATAT